MLAVHFGAGNIGRGFIGQLLQQAGYEVCFVDVNQELVDALNSRRAYAVQLAMEGTPVSVVEGVRAIHGQDTETVARTIAEADLVTTAVGPNVLAYIAPAIAAGIARRLHQTDRPLNVIACENMIGGSTQLKTHVFARLDDAERAKAEELVGFPDAAVDRIVPLQHHEDKLLVTVEPFFEWVVDQSHIVGNIPQIKGVTFVRDLTPYIERKLYTVNTGHAMIAYLGYQLGYDSIDTAIRDDEILHATRQALRETGALLVAKHAFDKSQHEAYVEKILARFANPYISDQVTRVGRSPIRKLSPQDRLVGPAMQCLDHGIVPEYLGLGIAAALLFDYREDPEAVQLTEQIQQFGLEHVLKTCAGIGEHHALFAIVKNHVLQLQAKRKTS